MSEKIAAAWAWKKAYIATASRFTEPYLVGQWRDDLGLTPEEAAAWANLGFLPEEAAPMIRQAITATSYAEAYDAEVAAAGGPEEHLRQRIVELFAGGVDVAPGVWRSLPGGEEGVGR